MRVDINFMLVVVGWFVVVNLVFIVIIVEIFFIRIVVIWYEIWVCVIICIGIGFVVVNIFLVL